MLDNSHENFPATNFTYTEYNPARVRLRDCGRGMHTCEKACYTQGYRMNWDGTMGEGLDCEVKANNARDRYAVAVTKDGRIVDH